MYVFDDQLNYSHTMTLPDVIRSPSDIILHRGSLLSCDSIGRRAYAVTMEGSESKVMYEFTKPDLDGGDWGPISLCKDKNGFIYMLWEKLEPRVRSILYQCSCILVQYSQDGRQLLTTRTVDSNAQSVDTIKVGEEDKIIIVTQCTYKLYTYSLIVT